MRLGHPRAGSKNGEPLARAPPPPPCPCPCPPLLLLCRFVATRGANACSRGLPALRREARRAFPSTRTVPFIGAFSRVDPRAPSCNHVRERTEGAKEWGAHSGQRCATRISKCKTRPRPRRYRISSSITFSTRRLPPFVKAGVGNAPRRRIH